MYIHERYNIQYLKQFTNEKITNYRQILYRTI